MAKIPPVWSLKFRLALALSAAVAIVIVLESLPDLRDMVQPLQRLTAMFAFFAVEATGLPIAIDDVLLTHPNGFRIAISYGCTPLVPAIFLGTVLTFGLSLSWRDRLLALTSSIALVTLLNLFRVTALYCIGVFSPGAFSVAHEWLGQGIIVLGTAVIALYWVSASARAEPPAPAL